MQKRSGFPQFDRGLLSVFSVFFILSLTIVILFRQQVLPLSASLIEFITLPMQSSVTSAFGGSLERVSGEKSAGETNRILAKQLVDQRELTREVEALRDQYALESVPSKSLVPAQVVGYKSFLPGVSLPEEIILDKGERHGVRRGQTVILTNNIVGSIERVTANRSLVLLITNKKQSLTAKTSKTNALGIVKGQGNGSLVIENVVLADKLEVGDIVVTMGEEKLDTPGYPPDFVLGKIVSVDKKASDLFQTAEIDSFIDFSRLDIVFIITGSL